MSGVGDFARQLGGIINTLITERGFELPLHLAVVAVNGYAIVARYTLSATGDGLECIFLAEHAEPDGLRIPINMMAVDSRGEAAHVVIGTGGTEIEILN